VGGSGIRASTSKKALYHEKTLSDSAVYDTFVRLIDVQPKFNEDINVQLPPIDFTEYGLGLLYAILPVEFQPLTVDFKFQPPSVEEILQGIWAKFEPVDFSAQYAWMSDFLKFVSENVKEEYQSSLIRSSPQKARYDRTPYGYGVYDPVATREFLRATFMRLRLLRTADVSWISDLKDIEERLKMSGVTDAHVYNRLMMVMSAQRYAFVLGLSVLGRSSLCKVEKGLGSIPIVRHDGRAGEVRFRTLDHLLFGFILGVTPLGYGLLMPKEGILKNPEGKKNPKLFEVVKNKLKGIRDRHLLTAFAYSNYNRPDEMVDYHKSDRTAAWHYIQAIRSRIEEWVDAQVRDVESNPVRIREYKSAALQAIFWRAKRHRWGFQGFQALTEDEWRGLWKDMWTRRGLDPAILDRLYEGMKPFVEAVRKERLEAGEEVKRTRTTMALVR